ncbi:ribonuclease P/MRP protein subunit POP5 isoform X2 [Lepidochelys kempii]|uniref:ribonuclease P/MRP protein subunit POP5 isoform X2 n=1 Tax=Caretta caretta TaxID=8467 RepID=UPI002095FF13|nr:ribonuclease P/MRP protein subunit POP5 isoform X2 [Caretta caretta]
MVRFKHRYLLCEIVSEDPRCRQCIDERAVSAAAKDAVARTHGDYGLACCSISFTGLRLPLLPDPLSRGTARTPETGSGVAHRSLDVERGVFVSVSQGVENRNQRYSCFFNTLHVGGTIRTCQKFLIQYNRKQLLLLLHNCTSEEERQSIQKSVLSCCLKEVEEEQSQSGDEDDCAETD